MTDANKPLRQSRAARLPCPFRIEDSDEEILTKMASFYAGELAKDASAIAYLEAQMVSAEAAQAHALGVGNRSLGLHLPTRDSKRGAALRGRLEALNILKETGHELLYGAIVVPLLDKSGAVVSLYGHKIHPSYGTRDFTKADDPRGLFNAPALVGAEHVVIADSVMSALSIWTCGMRAVTALHTFDAPIEEVIAAVQHAKRITLATPRTADFVKVTATLIKRLSEMHIEVLRVVLPGSSNATDVLKSEDGAYRLGQLLRTAEWVGGAADARMPIAAISSTPTTAAPKPPELPKKAQREQGIVYELDDRRWRVRGLSDNTAIGTLRVNIFVSRENVGFHVDSFDLYSARHRKSFLHQAALELGHDEVLLKRDLGQVLLWLEIAQAEMLEELRAPEAKAPAMTDIERAEALELLRDPALLERILETFVDMGVVGERDNLLAGYLVAISRKLEHPLALVLQSSSAAGKTALLDALLATVPEEERFSYAAVSGQSLYYMGKRSLRHRLLSIAEEGGADKATHALKLLQSSKELTIASTGKDGSSGRITSHEYKVEGPVALMITTSKVELDEELLHRCLVVSIDESPTQTEAVQAAQRHAQTLEGVLLADKRIGVERRHRNAQRLLRPLVVVNPHADAIAFHDRRVRARCDHRKLLSLIEAIALVHQHQRPIKEHVVMGSRVIEYIEATREDVALASRLMESVAGSAMHDLPPRTRELTLALGRYVDDKRRQGSARSPLTFTRREVREALGWGDTQLKTHLRRLVDAEIVLVHRADHGRGVAYELAIDIESAGFGRGSGGPGSGSSRPLEERATGSNEAQTDTIHPGPSEIAVRGLATTSPVRVPRAS